MDDDLSHDLSAWLHATARTTDAPGERYVVERSLRQTPSETTQVVYRRGPDGEPAVGPFVRKVFADKTLGAAYRLLLDAQVAGRHFSHLPLVYECERVGETFEVVMQYVQGETLASYVLRAGAVASVCELVFPQLCDALAELHEGMGQPVIHRDAKPSNIMVSDGHLTLIDLGIARAWNDGASRDTVRYGTPGYAPPEQYGYGQTGVRSDVYAAGMTLAFCLLGEDASPRLLESGFDDPRIPHDLREVLATATQFDPARRYGSARELRDAYVRASCPGALSASGQIAAQAKGGVPTLVGRAWNFLVTSFLVLLLAALSRGVTNPVEGLEDKPLWVLVVMDLGVFAVPFTCVAYMLLDKRRFSHPSWRRYVPACVGIAMASIVLSLLVYIIAAT